MNFKIYQKLIINSFLKIVLTVSLIFFALVFILNIFEEVNFFKDIDGSPLKPLLLTFLNTPYIIYEIFPFIILISTQFLFIKLIENNELFLLKTYGLNNRVYTSKKVPYFGSQEITLDKEVYPVTLAKV